MPLPAQPMTRAGIPGAPSATPPVQSPPPRRNIRMKPPRTKRPPPRRAHTRGSRGGSRLGGSSR